MGRLAALSLVVALAGCGRIGFDRSSEPLWAATFGGPTLPTWSSEVLEDPDGAWWVVGTSKELGPHYTSGWIAKLDGDTGDMLLGAVRELEANQNSLDAARLVDGNLFVVGSVYSTLDSEQPAYGQLDRAGNWMFSMRLAGGLITPGEYDRFSDLEATPDGGLVLVGMTRVGTGGCSTCDKTDALVVKLRADRTIERVMVLGDQFGDEHFERVLVLPTGELFAFGSGTQYDYSNGANTDISSGQTFMVKLDASLQPIWVRRIHTSDERGAVLADGIVDPAGGVWIAGAMRYGEVPVLAHVDEGATFTQVTLETGGRGAVTGIQLAAAGGLFLSGTETAPPGTDRLGYVARMTPARDAIVWARSFPLGYALEQDVSVRRAAGGGLLVSTAGGGEDRLRAVVIRISEDGAFPTCYSSSPATLQLNSVADQSTNAGYAANPVMSVPESLASVGVPLPSTPVAFTLCSQ